MTYALTFPGQGSQRVGMLNHLLETHASIVHETFAESSEAINLDLLDLCQNGPPEKINQTAITQPLMLCADITLWRILQNESDTKPSILSGHSLGEYAALVVAESLSLHDATQLVQRRGQLMQQAVAPEISGVAAIIGLEDEIVIEVCNSISDEHIVSAVNFNAPGQVVIAGHKDKVLQAMKLLKEANAKRTLMLPLSVPVHCALLKPIAMEFMETLKRYTLKLPKIPIIHNIDNAPKTSIKAIQTALIEQIYHPVNWVKCIQSMTSNNAENILVECGPGKVLFGLNRRIHKEAQHFTLFDDSSIKQFIHYLSTANK